MRSREVVVRTGVMAAGHARRARNVYRDDVLAPVAKRMDALPDGNDDDDAQTNEANLRRLLDSLDGGLLDEMKSDALAESLAEAGVHASLLGRAAVPKLPDERASASEPEPSPMSRPAGVAAQKATPPTVGGRNNGQQRRSRIIAPLDTEVTPMPENIEGASPRARLARMTKLLGMQPSADAPSVIQRLVDVLEVLSLENTDQGRQVLEEAGKLLLTTTEDRREEAKVQAMSEYRTSPGTMICAASTYVNQAMKDRHLPPLSDDEREQVDLIVPERR